MAKDIPSLHDARLQGIMLGGDSATLSVSREDGTAYTLKLLGVEALHVEDFREGNIIFDVQVISGRQPETDEIEGVMERLFTSPHPSAAAEYHDAHAAFLAEKLARVARGEASLVMMDESYGANLVAYCITVVAQRV